jgi:hypothetical protein
MPTQGNLFDAQGALTVTITSRARHQLSKEQKSFNSLIRQIDTRRQELAEWERAHHTYHHECRGRGQACVSDLFLRRSRAILGRLDYLPSPSRE